MLVLFLLTEMIKLVENVAEIAKITNYRGRSLTNGDVCPEKTYVCAENMCRKKY